MAKIVQEFKEFIMRGNVIDMAVGVVIGGAFKTIVDSLVNDVIMPPIGYLLGGVDFSQLKYIIQQATGTPGTEGYVEEVAINYGMFINALISFLIIALVIFFIVRGLNRLRERMLPVTEEEEEDVTEVQLLEEILVELKKNNGETSGEKELQ